MSEEDHQPIEAKNRDIMVRTAKILDQMFEPYGFCLLVFPMEGGDGRMNYISNAERATMLIAMKEFIARNEGLVPGTPKGVIQ